MTAEQLLAIVSLALLWAVVIGAATFGLLRLVRRSSLVVQFCLVLFATIGVLVAGMISAVNAMVITAMDLQIMWYIIGIASLVALGLSLLLGTRVARNAVQLAAAARSIGAGEAIQFSSESMSSELASLAQELEKTSARLEQSRRREAAIEDSRREMVTWISHDLRTPLASMRAMAEALEDGLATDASSYHAQIISQADQMAVMINGLLELSKIQEGSLHLSSEPLHLYDVVSDAIADLMPLAAQRGVAMDGAGGDNPVVLGDGPLMSRAVRNLILNAVLYTGEKTSVQISLARMGGNAVLKVADECGGIAAEDLERVFIEGWQKSPRLEESGYTGTGVGLSVAAGVINAHRGSLAVENTPDGCCFTAVLPLAEHDDDGESLTHTLDIASTPGSSGNARKER
ncbi:sensor histidine kinase [Arthrobacter sp. CAN_A1]|uniref:sensor histidine kinase n=1 Tax=Arthrobacter sp. CAN_A1 TaxID=2787717 RepID=UPI0018CAFEA4